MSYPDAAWEWAMTVQEVMLKALSGELHWFRAADILGCGCRGRCGAGGSGMRHGYVGLVDRRLHRPSIRRVAAPEVGRLVQAAFYPSESRQAVMISLAAVLRTEGIPMALYTDRAHWAFHTPKAKGPVDKTRLTQSRPGVGARGH